MEKSATVTYLLSSQVENSGFQSSAFAHEEGRKIEFVSPAFFLDLLDVPTVSSFPLHLSSSGASDKFSPTP